MRFHLFGNKNASLEEHAADCLRRKDYPGLAKAYYDMGVAAMKQGELNRAVLWLNRADTIYSASDALYEEAEKKRLFRGDIAGDCSERIDALGEEALLYNDVPIQVEEKAEGLNGSRAAVWGLLSLARLVRLGERLAALPGCGALGRLGWAVDAVLESFRVPPSEETLDGLRELCGALYDLGDDPAFWGSGSEAAVPGGAPVQVFDLNGMMGVHLEIEAYLDGVLRMTEALKHGREPSAPETGLIAAALLPDYFVRTGGGPLEDVPQIRAELERIWDDYTFVCSGFTWEDVARRAARYKALDILAL